MLGIGHAMRQKWVYDQHYGVPLAKRFHYNKPPTILDVPAEDAGGAVGLPIPRRRSVRAEWASRRSAPASAPSERDLAAVGDEVFRRAPVTADMILMALEPGRRDARGD